jgi:hypothetical protein
VSKLKSDPVGFLRIEKQRIAASAHHDSCRQALRQGREDPEGGSRDDWLLHPALGKWWEPGRRRSCPVFTERPAGRQTQKGPSSMHGGVQTTMNSSIHGTRSIDDLVAGRHRGARPRRATYDDCRVPGRDRRKQLRVHRGRRHIVASRLRPDGDHADAIDQSHSLSRLIFLAVSIRKDISMIQATSPPGEQS